MPVTPEEARRRLEQALTLIPDRYRAGISTARWKEATTKAAQTWQAKMQEAISKGLWLKGVQAANEEEWRTRAMAAADLIPTRLRAALDKWMTKWSPIYRNVLNVLPTLPPRTADPMANIDQRLKKVVQAWRAHKA